MDILVGVQLFLSIFVVAFYLLNRKPKTPTPPNNTET